MAKYVVLNDWKDKYTNTTYRTGEVVELTVSRANEVAKNLGDKYLFRIDNYKGADK